MTLILLFIVPAALILFVLSLIPRRPRMPCECDLCGSPTDGSMHFNGAVVCGRCGARLQLALEREA